MDFELRDIRAEEARELQRLARGNFSVVEKLFLAKPRRGVVAIAEDGQYAGGAFLIVVDGDNEKVGYIDIMFVLPRYRGSGVAKLLYHEAVEKLYREGCRVIVSAARGDNSRSVLRFEAEGLKPTTLRGIFGALGAKTALKLCYNAAAVSCGTGAWLLCRYDRDRETPDIGSSMQNILRVAAVNSLLLLLIALMGLMLGGGSAGPLLLSFLSGLLFLFVIVAAETAGTLLVGGKWRFIMPECGLVPSIIVALIGGWYPMYGHWYLRERENSPEYRRKMAAPAELAWACVLLLTFVFNMCGGDALFLRKAANMGYSMLIYYTLPFYPFDSIGGRRVHESSKLIYAILMALSVAVLFVFR